MSSKTYKGSAKAMCCRMYRMRAVTAEARMCESMRLDLIRC